MSESSLLLRSLSVFILVLVCGCDRSKPKTDIPPFLVLVEQDRGQPANNSVLLAFPLTAKVGDNWIDASCDPESEPGDWRKLSSQRFPLGARPALQAVSLGRPLGDLMIESVGPEEVACNRLVIGHARLKPIKSSIGSAKVPTRFMGFIGLPPQGDWTSPITLQRRSEIQKHLETLARTSLKTPPGVGVETPAWGWFQERKSLRSFVAGSLVFRLPQDSEGLQHLAVWNAVLEISDTGAFKTVWESSGTGVETEPPTTYEFLDVIDLEGDGIPEVLFRATAYESSGFALLSIGPGPAKLIWTGSGYGC